jgi:seryl-tRNA synthetase
MPKYSIRLQSPPGDMAREEILKQSAFLSKTIANVAFADDGVLMTFDAPEPEAEALQNDLKKLGDRVSRALRTLERKIVFANTGTPAFPQTIDWAGVRFLGTGQVGLSGTPLRLFQYFDRVFEDFGRPWDANPIRTPTLIPSSTLSKCDYFRSFPYNVTFAAHLREDPRIIEDFRSRHQTLDDLDDQALGDMERPCACLSPAVCYHIYHVHENETLPAGGLAYGMCGKCFRYESSNLTDLRRLWDFTMREVVFLGSREYVLEQRAKSIDMMSEFLRSHNLAAEIRTASDPFFIAPDAVSKTYFQLSSDSKFEVSLELTGGERLAVGSHNYHSDFFGRAFHTDVEGAGAMHSVCVAFGLERWVHAFAVQHGMDPKHWPDVMRNAPELRQLY